MDANLRYDWTKGQGHIWRLCVRKCGQVFIFHLNQITVLQLGGVMMLADVSHRLLRTDTCLNFM